MHLKDFQAGIKICHKAIAKALAEVKRLEDTLGEADHQISIVKELEKGTAIKGMALRIQELEADAAIAYAAKAK